jgi:hypothetical protein
MTRSIPPYARAAQTYFTEVHASESRRQPEAMSRELDPSWVALVDETIRRKVAAGDSDEEIWHTVRYNSTLESRHIDAHIALLRLYATGAIAPEPRRRGRTVSDLPRAIDNALGEIRRRHGKVTWDSVAVEISSALDITLDKSTLRGWCKSDGLPHPGERERLIRT